MEATERMLHVILEEIYPLTKKEVEKGNNLFGAAVLKKGDLSTVVVGTNLRVENPILHGEIATLRLFFKLKGRPKVSDCLFLSTHEPCPMCLSALAWSGFKEVYYFFSYEETRSLFKMPDDLGILKELFGVEQTRHENAYLKLVSLRKESPLEDEKRLYEKIEEDYRLLRVAPFEVV